MKSLMIGLIACACLVTATQTVDAQEPPQAAKEHELLKKDVGTWHAAGKMWQPGMDEAIEFEGTETNSMVGEFWIVTDFRGSFFGQDFHGHGHSGFNTETGKYEGVWIDSMSTFPMTMSGEYDAASKTLTSKTAGKTPTGDDMNGKSTVVYKDENTRVMTMWGPNPEGGDEMYKMMEITYTRKK